MEFEVSKNECVYVSVLDSQKKYKKGIFGSGLLISTKKTKEKVAALEAVVASSTPLEFTLSERENAIISNLDENSKEH